jgi:hypothetical protein
LLLLSAATERTEHDTKTKARSITYALERILNFLFVPRMASKLTIEKLKTDIIT